MKLLSSDRVEGISFIVRRVQLGTKMARQATWRLQMEGLDDVSASMRLSEKHLGKAYIVAHSTGIPS